MRFSLFLLSIFPRKDATGGLSCCGLPWFPAQIPAIAVAIEQGVNQVKVGSSKAVVRDYSTGRKLGQMAAMNAFYAQPRRVGLP